jgi:hypothetical protein
MVEFSSMESALFCHEHARAEKLDNGGAIPVSLKCGGEKLYHREHKEKRRKTERQRGNSYGSIF